MIKSIPTVTVHKVVSKKHIRRRRLTAETKYYILQKSVGIIIVILGVLAGVLIEDIAPLLLGCGIGSALLFTKEKVLMVGDVYWNENPITTSEKKEN